ncbi:MAG: hypothetical protein M5R36_23465 [Deltaproteobacteria bacterium]|nr:hypothetical protein [Deltaproteobacteria bacterium]
MKRMVAALFVVAVFAGGCSYVTRDVKPEKLYTESSMRSEGLEKFTFRASTRYGFRLVFIPISVPDAMDMVDEMIVETRAAGLTNLDIEYSEANFLLFQIPKLTIRADMVRSKAKAGGS